MTEAHPIMLIDFDARDLSRKQGRMIPGEPLVPVDEGFRAELAGQLTSLAAEIDALGVTDDYPATVKVKLHPKALAKSNRPYATLNRAGLQVRAIERPCELLVPATAAKLNALKGYVLSSHDARSEFDISTFVDFSLWGPDEDVMSGFPGMSIAEAQDALRSVPTLVEITLFPWLAERGSFPQTAADEIPGLAITESADRGDLEAIATRSGLSNSLSAPLLGAITTAGLESPVRVGSSAIYALSSSDTDLAAIAQVQGVRRIRKAPVYGALMTASVESIGAVTEAHLPPPPADRPVVGVLDSGISSSRIEPWVVGRLVSDPPQYIDPFHGTFVAGLIASGKSLNSDDERFPDDQSLVLDAQILPKGGLSPLLLIERIREVVEANSDTVRVWNCSFALTTPLSQFEYSVLAQEMDLLSQEHGVLFVQAAGNFVAWPDRAWPPGATPLEDGVSSPAEAIRSLTVGALSHLGGFVAVGHPTSYSRRGPSFAIQVKPEVTHWGGEVDHTGTVLGHGIKSVSTSDELIESIGTSFATPIVSTIAANLWQELERGASVSEVRPELIRGLLAHSAALATDAPGNEHRQYTGWGRPASSQSILTDTDTSFTTIHEVELTPQTQWVLSPFPVPQCLILAGNKFAGEAILTVSYDPPIRAEFGPEAVRYEVEGGFGYRAPTKKGEDGFTSITVEETSKTSFWEQDLIDDGKWSSLRTFRARHPKGKQGVGAWSLRLALLQRVQDEIKLPQKAYAILTLRSVGAPLDVYVDGLKAVQDLRLGNRSVVRSDQIRLRNQP